MTEESDFEAAPHWLPPPVFPSRIEQRSESVAIGPDARIVGVELRLTHVAAAETAHTIRIEHDGAVAELARVVGLLASGLQARGEPALEATPDMSHLEATLRAFCVGYLAGARDGRTV